jgi:GntR family transcriptional regulator, rspAB operon transcriptional repressor
MQPSAKPSAFPILRALKATGVVSDRGSMAIDDQPRITVARRIYLALRTNILELKLKPGSVLIEKALIERFDCSRTPLREALIRLAEEQLVVIFPQSGTYVSRIRRSALPSAVVVRQALECAAVEHAIEKINRTSLAQLDAIVASQSERAAAGDPPGFHAADEAFHAAIADIAGHPELWALAETAKTEIDRCRRLSLPVPGRMSQVVSEHKRIVDCMRRSDVPAAISAMRAHLSAVVPDAAALAETHPDYFI